MLTSYLPAIFSGALTTLAVALVSLAIAIVLGLAGAGARLSRVRVLRALATAYTTVVRGVPDLVLMLLIYYGGQRLLNAALARWADGAYVDVDPFIAGTLTIGFVYGAYLGETFRGAFLAVPPGQAEAARACGMSGAQVFRRVLGPLMLRHALAGAFQQLAGDAQEHGHHLRHRAARPDATRGPGRRRHARTVLLLHRRGRAVPGVHQRVRARAAGVAGAPAHGHARGVPVNAGPILDNRSAVRPRHAHDDRAAGRGAGLRRCACDTCILRTSQGLARRALWVFTYVVRGTPLLVQLFLLTTGWRSSTRYAPAWRGRC